MLCSWRRSGEKELGRNLGYTCRSTTPIQYVQGLNIGFSQISPWVGTKLDMG